MQMMDINDIKGKVDIINYGYLLFFVLLALFIYAFYYILNKFFVAEDDKEIISLEKIGEKQKLLNRLKSLDLLGDDFINEYFNIFFDYLVLIGKKDLRKKTLKEIKENVKETELKAIFNGFYYKGFMENSEFSLEEKTKLISDLEILINQSQI